MRRTLTAAALAGLVLLAGCGGGDDETSSTGASGAPAAPSDSQKEKALKEAAQGYYDAMIKGNVLGMSAYVPKECEDDFGFAFLGGEMFKQMFEGVTKLRVTEVKVDGDRGEILDGKAEGKVSDATKRLFEEDDSEEADDDVWQWKNGKWYTTCDATFGSASPSPSASP